MNLRKAGAILAVSCTAALGGCASLNPNGTTTTTTSITQTIAQIQQAAVLACSFLPTTATVANIIGTVAGVGDQTQMITGIAGQICAAVAPPLASAKLRKAIIPTVNGVVIHGRFVGAQAVHR